MTLLYKCVACLKTWQRDESDPDKVCPHCGGKAKLMQRLY